MWTPVAIGRRGANMKKLKTFLTLFWDLITSWLSVLRDSWPILLPLLLLSGLCGYGVTKIGYFNNQIIDWVQYSFASAMILTVLCALIFLKKCGTGRHDMSGLVVLIAFWIYEVCFGTGFIIISIIKYLPFIRRAL